MICRDHSLRLCCQAVSCVLLYKVLNCNRMFTNVGAPAQRGFPPGIRTSGWQQAPPTFGSPIIGYNGSIGATPVVAMGTSPGTPSTQLSNHMYHSTYYQYPSMSAQVSPMAPYLGQGPSFATGSPNVASPVRHGGIYPGNNRRSSFDRRSSFQSNKSGRLDDSSFSLGQLMESEHEFEQIHAHSRKY